MKYTRNPYIEPCCLSTTIGSLPHEDIRRGTSLMLDSTPEIPSWPQFPKRNANENMIMQFTEGMPGLARDGGRLYIDTQTPDFADQLTDFYSAYLAVTEDGDMDLLEKFRLSPEYAAGFYELLRCLPDHLASHSALMLKGQVTGPFTMGTNLVDENRRCAYYNDQLRDIIIKTMALKAIWQIRQLKAFGLPVIIFLDEPSLLGFGSQAFLTVTREDIINDINEVVDLIHYHGGLSGVHCEENTDWSLLMETKLDILNFDAYDHLQGITLYPKELGVFLERGGWLAWGIVPTLSREDAATETVPSLLGRYEAGVQTLVKKGFDKELLHRRTLLTPSCGAGGVLTEPLANRVLGILQELSSILRERYGFSSSAG